MLTTYALAAVLALTAAGAASFFSAVRARMFAYTAPEMPLYKKLLQPVLRVVIRPFRYVL